ncbi:MAG: S9 family peptidase [Planctomycetes bacterium]|nr:S9 family peptidase [Planctomycetota bacterium]
MKPIPRLSSSVLAAFLALSGVLLALPGARAAPVAGVLTPEAVARLRAATSARISPDGGHVAYVLSVPREPGKDPSGPPWEELHVLFPNGASRPFVTGEVNVSAPSWVPGGRSIAFLAKRGRDKHASLYAIPIDGGEARRLLSFGSDIAEYSFGPDGGRVAFIAQDPAPEQEEKRKEQGFNQEVYEESFRPSRVRIADLSRPEEAPRALDLPGFPSELRWAPRGSLIALALAPTPLVDDAFMRRRVRVVDAEDGHVVARIENPGKLGPIAWSPLAARIAYIAGEDQHDPSAGRLLAAALDGSPPRQLLPAFEGEVASVAWTDEDTVAYLASSGVWSSLGEVRFDGSGHRVRVAPGAAVLSDLTISQDGVTWCALGESPRHPPEVHLLSAGNDLPRRMTDSNPWLESVRLAPQEVVTFAARDGLRLEGILIRPLGEEKGVRCPLILSVHGGPEAHERNGWLTSYSRPGQVAAARGFAVFYPNYRGSTGRGVAFSKLGQGDPAGREFDDLVDAADQLVASGLADPKRIGITGGSYGGYATAWASTRHSDRFAAGVMFVGISDLVSKTGTTDIPTEELLVHARGKPHDGWQRFLERSPIYHARDARTPLLILHGKDDPRVHPSQSLELYRYLKTEGKAPVRLVLYPGEGHGNRKSAARLDYHIRTLQWFEHYLKGPGGEPPGPGIEYPGAPPAAKDAAAPKSVRL